MTIGLVGRKAGMTRVFTDDGVSVPVTVIEVEPNRVTQLKTVDVDGYSGFQITLGAKKASRVTKPAADLKVRVFRAVLSAGTLLCRMPLTVTQSLTVLLVPLVSVKHPVVYSRVRRWLVTWVMRMSLYRLWKSFA